jgi:hypothetical protein
MSSQNILQQYPSNELCGYQLLLLLNKASQLAVTASVVCFTLYAEKKSGLFDISSLTCWRVLAWELLQ